MSKAVIGVLVSSRSLGGSHNSFDIEQQSEKTNLGLSFIHVCLHFPPWFSTLCQHSSPYAASPSGFCALAGCVSMSDSSLLVYSWGCAGRVCAVSLGVSPMCRALPQGLQRALLFPDAGSLGVFRSPGVCPSASLVTWVGFQHFPSFSMHLLLRLLAGVAG